MQWVGPPWSLFTLIDSYNSLLYGYVCALKIIELNANTGKKCNKNAQTVNLTYGPEVMGAFGREIGRKYFLKWIARATHIYSDNNHLNICRCCGGNSKKYKELQICV